jgi:hypothetical protein
MYLIYLGKFYIGFFDTLENALKYLENQMDVFGKPFLEVYTVVEIPYLELLNLTIDHYDFYENLD